MFRENIYDCVVPGTTSAPLGGGKKKQRPKYPQFPRRRLNASLPSNLRRARGILTGGNLLQVCSYLFDRTFVLHSTLTYRKALPDTK